MLNTYTLTNGVKVATYKLPSLKSIHLRASIKGGSIVERKNNSGVAHFMEHMLVQGTPSHPNAESFSRYIESMAGNYGAFTERLVVSFYLTVPATNVDDAVRIGDEVFFDPIFDQSAIERERIAIIDEVSQRRDSHLYKISQYFLSSRFRRHHPLILDGGGTINTLKKLTRDDLIGYWKKYFYPENTYIHVSGNFSDELLKFSLEKYFGSRKPSRKVTAFPAMSNTDFASEQVSIRTDAKLSTCYVDLTFPSIGMCDDLLLRIKQNLALVILGQLRNSRLFRLLRYQKGLVYDVRAGTSSYPGLGYVYVSLEVGKDYLDHALSLIVNEINTFITNGPSEEELIFAKNYLTSQWLMAFDHPSSIAGWVESHLLWDDKILLPEDYAKIIQTITADDVVALMAEKWDFNKVHLSMQGPISNSAAKKLSYSQMLSKLTKEHNFQTYTPLYS